MQRSEDGGIVIVCDFTGVDWDGQSPMLEGHRGSVISPAALDMAIANAGPAPAPAECCMCLKPIESGARSWRHPDPPPTANPLAAICWDCIRQADRTFARDPDVEWTRRISPDARWS